MVGSTCYFCIGADAVRANAYLRKQTSIYLTESGVIFEEPLTDQLQLFPLNARLFEDLCMEALTVQMSAVDIYTIDGLQGRGACKFSRLLQATPGAPDALLDLVPGLAVSRGTTGIIVFQEERRGAVCLLMFIENGVIDVVKYYEDDRQQLVKTKNCLF